MAEADSVRALATSGAMWSRYCASALALKTLGSTRTGRLAYRALGDMLRAERHAELDGVAMARGQWTWDTIGERLSSCSERPRVLELGTGWTHFYGLFLRLAYPVELVFFDVVDNRSLSALRLRFAAVARWLRSSDSEDARLPDAVALAERVSGVPTFEALYRLVGASYVVRTSGDFWHAVRPPFDCVMSVDVLEHVPALDVDAGVAGVGGVLTDGGLSAHQIGLNDHLNNYAPGLPSKNYLRYGDSTWRLLFENRLQYINRLQPSDYRRVFDEHGFVLESESLEHDWRLPHQLRPARRYAGSSTEDLCATRMTVVHRLK